MKLIEICVGEPVDVMFQGKSVRTGIFKSPVASPVYAGEHNIAGDGQADLSVHGGRDKAIYAYSADYTGFWKDELGVAALEPAQFGQNLTVSGCTDDAVVIGTQYRLGDALMTVRQPRIPCFKLDIRLNDAAFANTFWQAGRLGFYLHVDEPGHIAAGQALNVVEQPAHGITLADLYATVNGHDAARAADTLAQLPLLDAGWQRRLRAAQKRSPR